MSISAERPRDVEVEAGGQRPADAEEEGQRSADAGGQRLEDQKCAESRSGGPRPARSGPELKDK